MANDMPHYTPIQCQTAIICGGISSEANQPPYSPVKFRHNISGQPQKEEHHRERVSLVAPQPCWGRRYHHIPLRAMQCRQGMSLEKKTCSRKFWGYAKLFILLSGAVRPNWEHMFLT